MKRLTSDEPKDNFSTMINYVFSRDGWAYIRHDGEHEDVPLTDWAKARCIEHGCDEFPGETAEEINETLSDCLMDGEGCPVALAYCFACQAVHLRDRLKEIEDILGGDYDLARLWELVQAGKDGRLVVLPCKIGDTLFDTTMGDIKELTVKSIPMMLYPHGLHIGLNATNYRGAFLLIEMWQIGKTIFSTREEAEAALERMKEEGND